MSEEINGLFALQIPAPIVWSKLIVPEGFEKKPPLNYSVEFLLDPEGEDLKAIKALFAKVAREQSQEPFTSMNKPFEDGNSKADKIKAKPSSKGADKGAFYRGKVVLKSSTGTDYPPTLAVFKDGDPSKGVIELNTPSLVTQYTGNKNQGGWFYSGALAVGVIRLKFYKKKNDTQRDGVKAYLSGVVTTGKGERLAGGVDLTKVYGAVSKEDPTVGMEPDIDDIV